jgi:hypothetical protein
MRRFLSKLAGALSPKRSACAAQRIKHRPTLQVGSLERRQLLSSAPVLAPILPIRFDPIIYKYLDPGRGRALRVAARGPGVRRSGPPEHGQLRPCVAGQFPGRHFCVGKNR